MQFRIRRGQAHDAKALADLAALTFPLACPPSTPASEIAAFIEQHLNPNVFSSYLADPHRVLFVAEERRPSSSTTSVTEGGASGDRLLAYTMLVDAAPSAADVAAVVNGVDAVELSKCYAHPDTHGTGVAADIMAASLAWIAEHGQRQAWLGVNSENLRAQKFYRKHGFAVAGTRSFQVGTRTEHDFVMMRSS